MPFINPSTAIKVTPLNTSVAQVAAVEARFRQLVADTGVAEIKKIIQSGIFKHPTGALANSIQGSVDEKAVVWWSDLPHAGAQEHGVKPHVMWYLLNKTIPIRSWSIGGDSVIYRRATLKAFMLGKFFHKGYGPKHFMKRGIENTVTKIPELFRKAQEEALRGRPGPP